MNDYENTITAWRETYKKELLAEHGWLSTIALNWLQDGDNLLGWGEQSIVSLDKARAPEQLAIIRLEEEKVHLQTLNGFRMNYQGKDISDLHLDLADNQNSDHLIFDGYAFSVIRRASLYGLRVFDKEAGSRLEFKGLNWFPITPKYCLEAEFVPYTTPRPTTVTNILGGSYETVIPGEAQFYVDDKRFTLLPVRSKQGLFFVFKDLTSLDLSYPPGRFLSTDLPINNKLILDFNKAYNPPCAFTIYATCPLPLRENYLDAQIFAGEKRCSA